ncbi:MAG TPA: DUF4190 domain-containing protein [Roseiflexaceae bacterium]|nr:DUF4190 domain-containing protein [Roseiflexaceae bacterium]
MNCTTCDAPLEQGALFCANCGARVTANQPASSAATPTIALPGGTQQAEASQASNQPGIYDAPQSYTPQSYTPQPYTPPAYSQQVTMPTSAPNSTAAVISLVFGILSWVGLVIIGAVVAIIAGHMARREIANSGGRIGGNGMATAGLILGYVHLAVVLLGCAAFFVLILIGAASS